MELIDDEAYDGAALFKTIEASRGTFFFSTSVVEKGAGGGGSGREMIDSNRSLPLIFTLRQFLLPALKGLSLILNRNVCGGLYEFKMLE